MRKAQVLYKGEISGVITQQDDGTFCFTYNTEWLENPLKPSISLTLPKTTASYQSDFLFSFFYNMLPEGTNKQHICQALRLDMDDVFGLLLAVAQHDAIGAVLVKPIL